MRWLSDATTSKRIDTIAKFDIEITHIHEYIDFILSQHYMNSIFVGNSKKKHKRICFFKSHDVTFIGVKYYANIKLLYLKSLRFFASSWKRKTFNVMNMFLQLDSKAN